MTPTQQSLLSDLERATDGSWELDERVARATGLFATTSDMGGHSNLIVYADFTRSLDSALTLVDEGYSIDLAICTEMGSVARVYPGPIRENSAGEPTGRGCTPALSLVSAALKARWSV